MQALQSIDGLSKRNGIFTAEELKASGLNYYQINKLLDKGIIDRVKRGVYISGHTDIEEPDLVQKLIPTGIFCLHSAAMIYDYSTHVPNQYHIAIESKENPTLPDFPPIKLYYWKKAQLELGVQTTIHNSSKIRIYDKEKTVCDFLKFRNKQERIVVNEIIRSYLNDEDRDLNKLFQYSEKLSIKSVLQQYLDILL